MEDKLVTLAIHTFEKMCIRDSALYKQKKFPEAAEQYQLLAGQGEKMIETPEGKARLAEIYHNGGNIGMQSKEYAKSVDVYKRQVLFNCESAEYEFNISNFVHLKKSK